MSNRDSLELQVITDDLTGLYNRRYLKNKLREETEKSLNEKSSFGLIMLDLDHFKEVNDNYGHFEGDQALLWITRILKSSVRECDFVVRFAGDEFFLILPSANLKEAENIAKRIYENISKLPFKGSKAQVAVPVGISGGIAIFPEDAASVDSLMSSADSGLYMAKEQGRGKVCLACDAKKLKERRLDKNLLKIPPFMGRDNELTQLKTIWNDISQNKKTAVSLILGESGMGKSRFIQEFLDSIQIEKNRYFISSCYPREYVVPYQSLIDLLGQWIKKNRELFFNNYLKLDAGEQREILKLIPNFQSSIQKQPDDMYDYEDADANNSRLYYGISNLFKDATVHGPLIFIIEDIHWIDISAFNLLAHIIMQIANESLLFILTAQPLVGEEGKSNTIKRFFRNIDKHLPYLEFVFTPLKNNIQKDIVRKIFNPKKPDELALIEDILVNESEGNPLFIKELILKALDEEIVVLSSEGWVVDSTKNLSTPDKIRDIATDKIESLDDSSKAILQAASVIGKEFVFDLLKMICEENEGFLLDIIDLALSKAILAEEPNSDVEVFRFTSMQVQKTLYEEFSSIRRRKMHLKIMKVLEKEFHTKRGDYIEAMFFHASKAKDHAKSFIYGIQSALKAFKNFGLKEADAFFENVMQHFSGFNSSQKDIYISQYHEAMTVYAETLVLLGDYTKALTILKMIPPNPCFKEMEGFIYFKQGDYIKSKELYEESFNASTDKDLKSKIKAGIAKVFLNEGQYDQALREAEESRSLAVNSSSPIAQALSLKTLGAVYFAQDNLNNSLKNYTESLRLYRKVKERQGIARCLNNIGLIHYKRKKLPAALNCFTKAITISKKISTRSLDLLILNNLGSVYLDMNFLKDAEENFEKCLEIAMDIKDISTQIAAYINLGLVYENENIAKCESFILKAIDICQGIGELSKESFIYNLFAEICRKKDEIVNAEKYYLQAIDIRKSTKALDDELFSSIKLLELYLDTKQLEKFKTLALHCETNLFPSGNTNSERMTHLKEEFIQLIDKAKSHPND